MGLEHSRSNSKPRGAEFFHWQCSGDSLTLGYAFNWTKAYPRRQENEAMSACQSLSLTRSMERKSGLLLSRFQAWPSTKKKVYLKQEMCSMLQPPYFTCVLLVSLWLGWWKVWDPNHFLSLLIFYSSCSDVSPTKLGEFYPSTPASIPLAMNPIRGAYKKWVPRNDIWGIQGQLLWLYLLLLVGSKPSSSKLLALSLVLPSKKGLGMSSY